MRIAAFVFLATLAACRTPGPEVLVSLDDGQQLVGRLATKTIALQTQMGLLEFDTAVAGELGLVEGANAKASGDMIRLWLKNGSEFVGKWQRPSVQVAVTLGEEPRDIDVPIAKLQRLQFRGDAIDSGRDVFRVVTKAGDDFFVDLTRTRLAFASDLGKFSPFLHEIASLERMGDDAAKWRVRLTTGTVLLGTLDQQKLDLRLAVGPERLELPLDAVAQMDKQQLDVQHAWSEGRADIRVQSAQGFYSNAPQKEAKERAASKWRK